MNLGRAKTALILAFLGLNIFLACCLFLPELNRLNTAIVSREKLRQVETELNRNNFTLEAPLARSIQKSAFITVAPSATELKRLRQQFSTDAFSTILDETGVQIYRSPGKVVRVHPGGLVEITYTAAFPTAGVEDGLSDAAVAAVVEQFLEMEHLLPSQAEFDYLEREDTGDLVVYFYRNDDEQRLFSSYCSVVIGGGRIRTVDIFWLDLLEWLQERSVEVIAAAEAVCKLVQEIGPSPQPCRIVQVDLGFYSQEYNAEQWEVPPVWRIRLDCGGTYYINAFTGSREAAGHEN